jgi:hypothetical protein
MEEAEEKGNGDETTTSGVEDGNEATDVGGDRTDGSTAKRRRKERRRNQLGTVREEIKDMDPASGFPTEPLKIAKGYDI